MARHFLLSAAARLLSAAEIMRMSDGVVENVFLRLRWPVTDGKPVCPTCGCMICYACRRSAVFAQPIGHGMTIRADATARRGNARGLAGTVSKRSDAGTTLEWEEEVPGG